MHPQSELPVQNAGYSAVVAALVLLSASAGAATARPQGAARTEFRDEALTRIVAATAANAAPRPLVAPDLAWERATVFTRGRPGAEVRRNLADLFDYSWQQRARGERTELTAPPRTRSREQAMREREMQAGAAQVRLIASYARRPPEFYQELRNRLGDRRSDDPVLTWSLLNGLCDPATHAAIALLGTLSDAQMPRVDSLESGERVGLAPQEWTPVQRELIAQAVRGLGTDLVDGLEQPEALIQKYGIFLDFEFRPGPVLEGCGFAAASNRCGRSCLFDPLPVTPETIPSRRNLYRYLDHTEDPHSPAARQAEAAYAALEKQPFPASGFRQSFPLRWNDVVEQLGARLEMPVYSDSYVQPMLGVDPDLAPGEETGNPTPAALAQMSVAEGLDALCRLTRRVWWAQNGALFFRSRYWYWDVLYQVPEPVIAPLQAEVAQNGRLGPEGIDRLAGLSERQLEGLLLLAENGLKRTEGENAKPDGMLYLLRVWSTLSNEQKLLALGAGLPPERLAPEQLQLYRAALVRMRVPLELLLSPPPIQLFQRLKPGGPPQGKDPGRPSAYYLRTEMENGRHPYVTSCACFTYRAPGATNGRDAAKTSPN